MLTWRHPRLPPSFLITSEQKVTETKMLGLVSKYFLLSKINCLVIVSVYVAFYSSEQKAGQSRLIRVTDNEGCVRYPT